MPSFLKHFSIIRFLGCCYYKGKGIKTRVVKKNRLNDIERFKTLVSYELLDTLPECIYDDITALVASICNTPISFINLFDAERQYFKSTHGISVKETALEVSFCKYLLEENKDELIIEDTRIDRRFSENPFVISNENIIFYAGVALKSPNGDLLGSLCVLDTEPKTLSKEQYKNLKILGRQVMQLFELRKAKKDIYQQKNRMTKIMDASLDIICTISATGHFLNINKACEGILGYTSEELVGRSFMDVVCKDDMKKTTKIVKSLLPGTKVQSFENRLIHKNSSLIPMLWSINWDKNDGLLHCIAKDITKVKKAENKLFRSEKRFKTLVQEGSDLIAVLDTNAIYSYISPSSTKVLQIPPHEFLGTSVFDYIHTEDKKSVREQFLEVKQKSQVQMTPFRLRNKKGEWRWIESIAINQINEPTLNGIVLNSRDITERILCLKAIKEQNAKLKEIAWNQSHVVRPPVARLKGLISLLKEEQLNSMEREKVLNHIFHSGEEIDKVIQETVEHTYSLINLEDIK